MDYRSTMLENIRYWEKEKKRIGWYTTAIDILEEISAMFAFIAVVQWVLVFNYIYWWVAAIVTGVIGILIGICMIFRGVFLIRLSRAIAHSNHRQS